MNMQFFYIGNEPYQIDINTYVPRYFFYIEKDPHVYHVPTQFFYIENEYSSRVRFYNDRKSNHTYLIFEIDIEVRKQFKSKVKIEII